MATRQAHPSSTRDATGVRVPAPRHSWDPPAAPPPLARTRRRRVREVHPGAVRLLLTTRHPMFIFWGPELIQFYNDAYRRSIGPERHPSALGQRGRDCWEEI